MRIEKIALQVMSVIISLLFAGNIFFIVRLVDKVERAEESTWQLRQDVAIVKVTLDTLLKQSELNGDSIDKIIRKGKNRNGF